MKRIKIMLALGIVLVLASCGSDPAPICADEGSDAVVCGEVVSIDNSIAVDGGITLDVDVSADGVDRLLFPSLFTYPPPTDEVMALYEVVRQVEVGDMVRAEGTRGDRGLMLEKLWVLDGGR